MINKEKQTMKYIPSFEEFVNETQSFATKTLKNFRDGETYLNLDSKKNTNSWDRQTIAGMEKIDVPHPNFVKLKEQLADDTYAEWAEKVYRAKLAMDKLLNGSSHRGRFNTYIGIGRAQPGIKVSQPVVYSYYDKASRKQTTVVYIQEMPIDGKKPSIGSPLYRNFLQAKELAIRPLISELKKMSGNPDIVVEYGEENQANNDGLVVSVKKK